MGCDWTKTLMIDSFLEKYVECEEIITNKYVEKIMKREMEREESVIYSGLKKLQNHYYSTIAFLLSQESECIKCPNCSMGYATILANENISCNWCTHTFFPKYYWSDDKELSPFSAQKLIDNNSKFKEIKNIREKIIDKYRET